MHHAHLTSTASSNEGEFIYYPNPFSTISWHDTYPQYRTLALTFQHAPVGLPSCSSTWSTLLPTYDELIFQSSQLWDPWSQLSTLAGGPTLFSWHFEFFVYFLRLFLKQCWHSQRSAVSLHSSLFTSSDDIHSSAFWSTQESQECSWHKQKGVK